MVQLNAKINQSLLQAAGMEMRKPCYQSEKDMLVFARVARKKGGSWHWCKAHISRGGPSSTTKVSQDFATRAGWLASRLEERKCQPVSSGQRAAGCATQALERFPCLLAVGDCQIEIMVETTDNLVFQGSSGPLDKIEPHMHIGETDFMALQRSGWDDQICYLDRVPLQKGPFVRPPECPSPCRDIADALTNGHPDCMRYWHTKPLTPLDPPYNSSYEAMPQWHQSYCTQAARWPSPEVLMYMRDIRGLSWYDGTCAAAAAAGSRACLSYAHCSGAPWDASVCSMAAAVGSMECLEYAHEHGCEWNWETYWAAIQHGHLDCLQYALMHGCPGDEHICTQAAGKGNLEILTYAFENGCRWSEATCSAAAHAGSMECLVYAHERGCPWDAHTCERAAAGRHLECLRYAHEQGCHWDKSTLYASARAGDIECLRFAHQHGCPYNDAAAARCRTPGLTSAAVHGEISLHCLKYVRESMNCSWDSYGNEWKSAYWAGRCDVLEYIHIYGGARCNETWLLRQELDSRPSDLDKSYEGRARCLLYMHCCGGCKLPPLTGSKTGEQVVALMRAAVLLGFRAARQSCGGSRAADAAAAHAAMAMVPADLIKQIICAAKLLMTE